MSAHKACPERSRRGFTLVELLVVISIIAILSVIGITVFSGVQKNARDAKRRGDIDSIAKAMEVHHGEGGGLFSGGYAPLKNSHFASGQIPKDPNNGSSSCGGNGDKPCMYCDRSGGLDAAYQLIPGSYSPGPCQADSLLVGKSDFMKTHGSDTEVGYNFGYWTWDGWSIYIVCTNLESSPAPNDYYCKSNQQ